MKKITLIGAFLAMACIANAQLIYEPFTGTPEASLTGDAWTISTNTPPKVVATPLSYDGLRTNSSSNAITYGGSGTIGSHKLSFAQQTSGVVYASFIINVSSLQDWVTAQYKYNFCFVNSANTFSGSVNIFPDANDPTNKFILGVCKKNNNSYSNSVAPWNIANSAIVWGGTSYPLNTNIFLVLAYDLSVAGDKMSLWVNPDKSTFEASTPPSATIFDSSTATAITATHNLAQFNVRSGSGSPTMIFDELRISTSWAEVTPKASTSTISASSSEAVKVAFKGNSLAISGLDGSKVVSLYSTDGKLVKAASVEGNQLDATGVQPGIYIVKVASAKGTKSYKAVKK
jgi:hypothetical protein